MFFFQVSFLSVCLASLMAPAFPSFPFKGHGPDLLINQFCFIQLVFGSLSHFSHSQHCRNSFFLQFSLPLFIALINFPPILTVVGYQHRSSATWEERSFNNRLHMEATYPVTNWAGGRNPQPPLICQSQAHGKTFTTLSHI